MNTTNITVLVWDEKSNFYSEETQRSLGEGMVFKSVILIESKEDFENKLNELTDEDSILFACHVKMEDLSIYENFRNSRITVSLRQSASCLS